MDEFISVSSQRQLPIEDHALIGDGATAALVGRDGSIPWLCLPRFDSPPLFCRILDADRGGAFTVAPERMTESHQYYEPDTGVVVTEMRSPSGLVQATDALTLRSGADLAEDAPAGRCELLRRIKILHGSHRLKIDLKPTSEFKTEKLGGGLMIICKEPPEVKLQFHSSIPFSGLNEDR